MQETQSMTLGSFFDGIGGALLAAQHADITPVWASELESFPKSITEKHFPNVIHLGDITKIDPDTLPPVDIICAGSPCQDLSIAGKREGLNGERSGLFRTAINLIHRLRERTGKPRFFVWENVPGAFSSNKGADFRAVLEEIGQTEIPIPQNGKWANAGMAELPKCQIAWRILDAQYWECPNAAVESFLSRILQPMTDVPEKYYLSAKACLGILRRAKERGKDLPEDLRIALERQAHRHTPLIPLQATP